MCLDAFNKKRVKFFFKLGTHCVKCFYGEGVDLG